MGYHNPKHDILLWVVVFDKENMVVSPNRGPLDPDILQPLSWGPEQVSIDPRRSGGSPSEAVP